MDTINSDGVQSLDSGMFIEAEDYESTVSTDEPYSENRPLSGNAAYAAERKRRVSNKRDSVKSRKQSSANIVWKTIMWMQYMLQLHSRVQNAREFFVNSTLF
ncbi:hypothetical protein MIR68_008596 [Amoeboaphelidium protococcarum]|nr:hypothetical protein MIR68_008596 [Amoeboaphelidium protococcarum]KAI3644219.1 hypothetical protein MP228_010383 [Amoeboaphelidium protococcarum]